MVAGDVEETERLRDAEALPTVKNKKKQNKIQKNKQNKTKKTPTQPPLKKNIGAIKARLWEWSVSIISSLPESASRLAVDGTTGAHLAHGFRAWMCECGLYLAAKHAPFMCF